VGRYLLRRLVISIPVLIGISMFTFAMVAIAPGNAVTAMINPEAAGMLGPDWIKQQEAKLGLDQPLPIRYLRWSQQILQGNLGYSATDQQPIANKIGVRIEPTLVLMGSAFLISLLIAIPIGALSAIKQYSIIDHLTTILGFTAISIPSFFLALAGIFIFGLKLGWLPVAGMHTIGKPETFGDLLHHLALPAFVLGLASAAPLIRYVRSSMLEVIHQPYISVARAKGVSERAVMFRHAARNALIPVITVVALALPSLLGGTVIIETIFAWPGMGQLAITAVRGRDFPMILALNLLIATLILLCNLLADVLYGVVDPRITYS
jgi:peptide/nickel transport system permease protein